MKSVILSMLEKKLYYLFTTRKIKKFFFFFTLTNWHSGQSDFHLHWKWFIQRISCISITYNELHIHTNLKEYVFSVLEFHKCLYMWMLYVSQVLRVYIFPFLLIWSINEGSWALAKTLARTAFEWFKAEFFHRDPKCLQLCYRSLQEVIMGLWMEIDSYT